MMPNREETIGYLNNAVEESNYADLASWPDQDIAADLIAYCEGYEDAKSDDPTLIEHIQAWRAQLKNEDKDASEASA